MGYAVVYLNILHSRQPIAHRWWRHQMETISALLALCAGNSPVTGEFPSQRPVTRNFDVFFDLRLNKRLSKQSWGWWLETTSRSLWRHCNEWHVQAKHGDFKYCIFHSHVIVILPHAEPNDIEDFFVFRSHWHCNEHRRMFQSSPTNFVGLLLSKLLLPLQ